MICAVFILAGCNDDMSENEFPNTLESSYSSQISERSGDLQNMYFEYQAVPETYYELSEVQGNLVEMFYEMYESLKYDQL
ncbi:hypothetical protein A5886_001434 [Enterococcus sp. 8G7_MSG3316]|uniref:Uncharacterized protein n=1 Tax=Candidatus Enterococcus testudinis TaxID=1834191 RepID=A0A242A5P1_9ENTE|nr:hypothetical protein A5886_001434 [Enterococcus sp. 8G7_MSG3316]